jgi:hypothetical protein
MAGIMPAARAYLDLPALPELIMSPDADWCRVPGKPKDLETRGPQNAALPPNSRQRFPGTR